ncbi:exodeoxyribonuclease VII large subunit [Aureliella helgolandensis]|uniref:Exodeoxyribonuclease 7 large subunit n=1 Tax=Aureliella helgolandensis TaxID=2527968 RepID=A0A518GEH5_9BACT|nr:exodeoxyribonuclease VII large subunit [Aureliella helgolandensis]QDV26993.1 Exodeoxyribonuclease 7 large subunit [Aureliella helgolandensis]
MQAHEDEDEFEPRGHQAETPLSISQLNWFIKNLLERSLPSVWAEGEISDLSRPSSGHIYFTLKDDRSQIRAVMWRSTAERLKFRPEDGMAVVCRGAVEVYPPRGSYQLIVQALQPQGVGPLQLAFQQLHAKLTAQGLFAPERKSPLPKFPRRIGFVTSPSGAAIHDFLEAAKSLWNDFQLFIIPARVQGEQATQELVNGIELAQRINPPLDLLIVGRGGGSMEDLWCFNEEAVVQALAKCSIPTVSAVGHEIDVTLSDLVADARALTPTHAAQLVFPNRSEIQVHLEQLQRRLNQGIWNRAIALKRRLENIQDRSVIARPHDVHRMRRQLTDEWELRGRAAIWNLLRRKREKLSSLARATEALSPLGVLARGYSLTRSAASQQPVRSVDELQVGQTLETVLADGTILSRIEEIAREKA